MGAVDVTRIHLKHEAGDVFLGNDCAALVADPFRAGFFNDLHEAAPTVGITGWARPDYSPLFFAFFAAQFFGADTFSGSLVGRGIAKRLAELLFGQILGG
jgi:hypothetical protein